MLFRGGWVDAVKTENQAGRMDSPGENSWGERRDELAARKEEIMGKTPPSFGKTKENTRLLSKVWS